MSIGLSNYLQLPINKNVVVLVMVLFLCACSGPEEKNKEPERRPLLAQSNENDSPLKRQDETRDSLTKERLALSEKHFASGHSKYQNFQFKEARIDLEKAVQANPDSTKARYLLQMAKLLLDEGGGCLKGASSSEIMKEPSLWLQNERIELKRDFDDGETLMAAKAYEGALLKFEEVLERIKWSPYNIDYESIEDRARKHIIEIRSVLREISSSAAPDSDLKDGIVDPNEKPRPHRAEKEQ